jgi:serine protease AprX
MGATAFGVAATRWAIAGAAAIALTNLPAASGVSYSSTGTVQSRVGSANTADDWAGGKWGDATADGLAKNAYGQNAAQQDAGSLFTVEKALGVRGLWGKKDSLNRNITGQGVGVALLDTGINQVPGLDAAGKVIYGPDLSIEGNGVLADQDTYGHGTFMAGIIAGRGAGNPSSDLPSAPANVQLGVAPDAQLLAVKLATTDGSTDVSQVIAALEWVSQHPVLPNGTRIRVINLSYGTDSAQDYLQDPLAAAAENAWRHGIVVVTSAGNSGSSTGRLTDPAMDPYLLAVGAADSQERTDGWAHDHTRSAAFSSLGQARHPDLLAPGTSIVSARDPGSWIDVNHPEGRVSGDFAGRLFRGSGTSQAAAVVSGVVADLLQAFPALTPDQVKYALVASAQPINNGIPAAAGAGIVNVAAAYDTASHLLGTDKTGTQLRAAAVQSFPQSTGQGSIEAARGGSVLVDADGNELTGEVDVQGNQWDGAAWYQAASSLTAWSGGAWLGHTWTGDDWQGGLALSAARWSAARWSAARWSDADWTTAEWTAARWSAARWSAARWSAARWSADVW